MKKNLQIVFFSFLILCSVAFAVAFRNFEILPKNFMQNFQTSSQKLAINSPKIEEENVPFFVITGFGSDLHNITKDSILQLAQAGKVHYFLKNKDEKRFLMDFFGKEAEIFKETELEKFKLIAKDNFAIVTIENLSNRFKALKVNGIDFFENAENYPFILKKDEKFDYKGKITKFSHTGVTAITRNMGLVADTKGTSFLTSGVKSHFQNSDFVHISNEVSITKDCQYVANTRAFCTKERDMQAIKDLNANIVELTGNHNKDFGAEGFAYTMEWYKRNNMQTFGGGMNPEDANKPLIITLKDGKKMAFMGYSESCPLGECAILPNQSGANKYNKAKAKKTITDLKQKQKIDMVFVGVQFNEVDSYSPTIAQDTVSKDLINFGADVVYGSQAHQVQKIEIYKGKMIFHGLGNFLFDQIHRIGVRQAYFLQHYLYNGKIIQSVPYFTYASDARVPIIAPQDQEKVMRKIVFEDKYLYK